MLQCMLWSWYLANDTQFYIIGILILLVSVRFDTSLSASMQQVLTCFYHIVIFVIGFYCFMRESILVIFTSDFCNTMVFFAIGFCGVSNPTIGYSQNSSCQIGHTKNSGKYFYYCLELKY